MAYALIDSHQILVLTSCAVIAVASSLGCTSQECTDDLRAYGIAIDRQLPVTSTPSRVEACVGSRCKTYSIVDGTVDSSTSDFDELLSGSVAVDSNRTLKVALRVTVPEGSARDRVDVRVRLSARDGSQVLEVAGAVPFSDEDCHPLPSKLAL